MKKKIAVLISFMMVLTFALAACGGGSEDLSDSKYLGTWQSESISALDESDDFDSMTLTLNGDGTGTTHSVSEDGEEDADFTWSTTSDGFKTKGGIKLTFVDDGDAIKTSILGAEIRFVRAEEGGEEPAAETVDGSLYGYTGNDPVELAVYKYMAETVGSDYSDGEISIPTVRIVNTDTTPEDEVLVYGEFWVENYDVVGDTLKCVSGGQHAGCMHVSKADNTVTAFDQVADGGEFDASAKEIFGDSYDDFMAVYNDTNGRDELRKTTVSDYVRMNGLTEVTKMQDEGWDPVDLYTN